MPSPMAGLVIDSLAMAGLVMAGLAIVVAADISTEEGLFRADVVAADITRITVAASDVCGKSSFPHPLVSLQVCQAAQAYHRASKLARPLRARARPPVPLTCMSVCCGAAHVQEHV